MKLIPQNLLESKKWDDALQTNKTEHFLQSWTWGEFQAKVGNKVWRLAIENNGQIINQLQILKLSLGFGWSLLYAPKGNLVNKSLSASDQQASARILIAEIKKIAKGEKVILFRIDPHVISEDKITSSIYRSLKFILSRKNIQPRHSLVLAINQNPDTLLNNMKQKTRYNIRLSEKKGVQVKLATKLDDIKHFISLTHQTAQRDGFKAHSPSYYTKQFKTLAPKGLQDLFLAYKDKTPIAGILVNKFGDTATYVHGASSNEYRNLMAPYLIQFAAINKYHEDGYKNYDFWGIHPEANHSWAGITRFKRGFGGQEIEYIGTLELSLHPTGHRLYKFINRFRR